MTFPVNVTGQFRPGYADWREYRGEYDERTRDNHHATQKDQPLKRDVIGSRLPIDRWTMLLGRQSFGRWPGERRQRRLPQIVPAVRLVRCVHC
jgi:hypothetical protein